MRRLFVICALLLLAIACEAEEKKGVSIESPFLGGTQGLSFEFQDFRSEVFDGGTDPFDIVVRLENVGEALVPQSDVQVRISGFNPAEFGKSAQELVKGAPDDLIEQRKDPQGAVLPGSPVFVEFTDLNYEGSIAGAQAEFPVRAEVCYLYRTRAVSKLCVRENVLSPEEGGICEINEEKRVFNSGAPVQVVSLSENARGSDRIGFTFEVQNVGAGRIFERGTGCGKERRQEDRVFVRVKTGLEGVQCTGLSSTGTGAEGFVTVFGGSKIISCSQGLDATSDFEQLVNIELVYDYEELTQTALMVKSSGE